MLRLPLFSVLLCAEGLCFGSLTAQGQDLMLPSPAIVLPNQQTTPIENFVSQTLLPLAEKALASSENSDQKLAAYRNSYEQEKTQRQSDNAERMKEVSSWQSISETLSLRVGTLQTFSDSLLAKLGDFSGSEDQKHAAAILAIDKIQANAKALEAENGLMKYGYLALGTVAAGVAVYKGGHALRWW